jgi:hypothetical protein
MSYQASKVVFSVALALLAPSLMAAPTKQKVNSTTSSKTASYATQPLDVNTESLPANYLGHSCRSVAKSMASADPVKDEFETTAAFKERLAKVVTKPILGSVTISDYVAFLEEDSKITSQYDADSGILWIGGHPSSGKIYVQAMPITSVRIETKLIPQPASSASNAPGNSTNIKKISFDTCALGFPQFGSPIQFDDYKTSVSMSPDEARNTKDNIGVLFVGKLSHPYRVKYSDYLKPTSSNPVEVYWSGDTLILQDIQVWLFNKMSGRILQKVMF